MLTFFINDRETHIDPAQGKATLKTIRKNLHLTGTKESCGEGDCGACMVLLGEPTADTFSYKAINSCLLPVGAIHGKHVVTIEGLNFENELSLIQNCFVEKFASQCGFCTPGFIVSLTGFLLNAKEWSDDEAFDAVAGNMCRCTGYASIKRAISLLGEKISAFGLSRTMPQTPDRIKMLIEQKVLPEYFSSIPSLAKNIAAEQKETSGIIIGGGTDLLVQIPDELEETPVSFISKTQTITEIHKEGNHIFIGGGVTFEDFRNSEYVADIFPNAREAFSFVASLPIRQRATVAGNIVNASPIGDITVFLLALNAIVSLRNGETLRKVPLRDFFKGYKKIDKTENEIVEYVSFEIPAVGTFVNFEKVSKRPHLDIASVNASAAITFQKDVIEKIHLSAGGLDPIPMYLSKTCEFLTGKTIRPDILKEAASIANDEVSPISDARGSERYKRLLLKRLLYAHFLKFIPHLDI